MPFVIEDASPGTVDASPDLKDMAKRYGVPEARGGYVIEDADTRSPLVKGINNGARAVETTAAQILSAVGGMPGDLSNLVGFLASKAGIDMPKPPQIGGFPTSADIMSQFEKVAPAYQFETPLGKYANKAAVGAGSAMVFGGPTALSALAGAGGGIGAQAGHDLFPESPLAEVLGGILGGGAVGGGYSWLRPQPSTVARNIIKDARTPLDEALALQRDSSAFGLGTLTAPESMNSNYGLQIQRLLEQDPLGVKTRATMSERGTNASRVSGQQLDGISSLTPREGADAVQAGAKGAIDTLKAGRESAGSPGYKAAFASTPVGIDPAPIFAKLKEIGDTQPAMRPVMDKLARTVMVDRYGRPITDLEKMQNGIKFALDDIVGKATTSGQGKLASSAMDAKKSLLEVLDTVSPEFKQARQAWESLSQPVNDAERGLIGALVNNDKSIGAVNRPLSDSAKIFINPKNETPADITKAAAAISQANGDAVPALVKQYLHDKLDAAKGAVVSDTSRLGAKFNQQTLGATELEPRQAANVEAAIRALPDGSRIWNGFERVMAVYRAQGNRYMAGSPTSYNNFIRQDLAEPGAVSAVGRAVSTAGRSIWDSVQNARLRSTYSILDRVLSSPDSIEQLRAIAREPSRRRVQVMVGSFMGDAPGRIEKAQPTAEPD